MTRSWLRSALRPTLILACWMLLAVGVLLNLTHKYDEGMWKQARWASEERGWNEVAREVRR